MVLFDDHLFGKEEVPEAELQVENLPGRRICRKLECAIDDRLQMLHCSEYSLNTPDVEI